MARFTFRSGFFLLLSALTGERVRFEAGEHEVPDEYAAHPFLHEMGERIDTPAKSSAEAAEAGPAPVSAEVQAKEPEPVEEPASAPEGQVSDQEEGEEPEPVETAADDEPVNDRDALRSQAAALGIDVDNRWGIARLQAEIAAKTAEAA